MIRNFKFISVLLIAGTLLSCAYNKVEYNNPLTFKNEDKGLNATLAWTKNKKNSIDVLARLLNTYDHPIYIKEDSFQLDINGQKSYIRRGSGAMELRPGESIEKLMIFPLVEGKRSGIATLKIDPIFEGPFEKEKKKQLPALTIKIDVPLNK